MQQDDLKRFELPDLPGVYLFKKGKTVLYVGKATSLRDRVRSYFDNDLIVTRGPRVVDMVTRADKIYVEVTTNVLEALVREAILIKKYKPVANIEGKDDTTFLHVVVTKEDIPRVLTLRAKDIDFEQKMFGNMSLRVIFGPFPHSAHLREGLRLIRRMFPFFDTPRPVSLKTKHQSARIEFNTQIGNYPRIFNSKDYLKNIRNIIFFLSGHVSKLRTVLQREMKTAAKEQRFEEATIIRKQLFALDHIQDVSLIKESGEDFREGEQMTIKRVEAYDTAHLSGTNAIGVMVMLEDGVPNKKEYRTFKIRQVQKNDDIASLREVLSRRLRHQEWPLPDVIVVDGGRTHKIAAERVLSMSGVSVPVVAVVKDDKHNAREILGARLGLVTERDAVLANKEAHRFSLRRHREARLKGLRVHEAT